MRIIVTGGGGFVGSQLVRLLAGHEVVALEKAFGALPALLTPVAESLGFSNDSDLPAPVARTLEEIT